MRVSLISTPLKSLVSVGIVAVLSACGSDDNISPQLSADVVVPAPPAMRTFEVSVTNLTANQPISPLAAIVHDNSFVAWQVGQPVSVGFEELAESGTNEAFLAEADGFVTASGDAPFGPAATQSVSLQVEESEELALTVTGMLVNTNDAITGITGYSLNDMDVDESRVITGLIWDAGTEANSEAAGTIPGPADGGEGFNPARDDVDFFAMHPGVIGADDGLALSVLNQSHRFDNGAVRITITRVE